MNAETERAAAEVETRGALEEKEAASERLAAPDTLSIVHGWRFVPDEIDLKKRIVYSLAMGVECLAVWAYKQILPFIEQYGVAEFESAVFPKLMVKRVEDRYTQYEIRQELERCVVAQTQRIYQEHAAVFFQRRPSEKARRQLVEAALRPSRDEIRVLFLLLRLTMENMEETDVRIIEVLVFFGYVLDVRVFEYLTAHFQKEKDFQAELLLVKMKFRQAGIPPQQHLNEAEIAELFKTTPRKEQTPAEEEAVCKAALLELLAETELYSVTFAVTRCSVFLQSLADAEMVQRLVEKSKDAQKAVRMQCVVVFSSIAHLEAVEAALLEMLSDADDDIKLQARISVALAIPHARTKAAAMISHFVEWVESKSIKYEMYLPGALITAKKTGHPETDRLYREYCRFLMNSQKELKSYVVETIPQVFGEFISSDLLVAESLKGLTISSSKTAGSVVFPSPDMSPETEPAETQYTGQCAASNLEAILECLFSSVVSLNLLLELLAQLSPLISRSFLSHLISKLLQKDPERNWRYWTKLMRLAADAKDSLTAATKHQLLEQLKQLETHWAHAVRLAAKKCRQELTGGLAEINADTIAAINANEP